MSENLQQAPARTWPLFAIPLALISLGLGVAYLDVFSGYRQYVSPSTVPEALVRSGQTGKQLAMVLKYIPDETLRVTGFDPTMNPEDMPSTTVLDAEVVQSGLPIISIVANSDDLTATDTGIVANFNNRGLAWERPVYASYFRDGQLVTATGAGLRIHGGKSRNDPAKSFRLAFRGFYGAKSLSRNLFFEGSDAAMGTLVIHNDVRVRRVGGTGVNWHYVNPIAYEIAERIGCITPDTQPVQFYLNGVYQGPYVLKERVWEDFLVSRFGHDNFFLADTKGAREDSVKLGNEEELAELSSWPMEAEAPLTMAQVEEKVDLDNLTNWFISILFSGTTDPYQGAVARDKSVPDGRWFWINWDMDHSFMDLYGQAENAWEIDNFTGRGGIISTSEMDMRRRPFRNRSRAMILNRLREESPEYRVAFLSRLTEVLNHELTPEFLQELVDRYEETAKAHGIESRAYLDLMRKFFTYRPAVLRKHADTYFSSGPSYRLTVSSSSAAGFKADGHKIDQNYSGWYFADTPARVEFSDPSQLGRMVWVVDGVALDRDKARLDLHLSADTVVELRSID